MSVLVVDNLQKSFGGVRAVDGVSFDVMPGETLAIELSLAPVGAATSRTYEIAMVAERRLLAAKYETPG